MLLLIATGCNQPVNNYSYINLNRLEGWKGNTALTLNFDMADTVEACELYIAGEIAIHRSIGKRQGYPVNLTFIAPNGCRYTDSIFLPLLVKQTKGIASTSQGIMAIEWPYRKNIYNKLPGRWQVMVTKGDTCQDYSNIIGMGIHCKQRKP